jgi:CheY-like chemotaxis protein
MLYRIACGRPILDGGHPSMMFEIYVIEDDQDVSESIRETLEDAGFRVTQAPDAPTALARLRAGYRPAAMIVDIMMPEMTGIEFLGLCRQDPALCTIPAVVVSAAIPVKLDRRQARYVAKPFSVNELLDALLACFDEAAASAG